tara:strand:- start:2413 stop:2562 length:150 start_codon:yes stop_codon:yes gene_type:complete
MEIGTIVQHFVCDYRGRIVAMANGLVHVLVDGVGVVEDRVENFVLSEAA